MPDIAEATSHRLETDIEKVLSGSHKVTIDWKAATSTSLERYRKYVISSIEKRIPSKDLARANETKEAGLKAMVWLGALMSAVSLSVFCGANAGFGVPEEQLTGMQDIAFFGGLLSAIVSFVLAVRAFYVVDNWRCLRSYKPLKPVEQILNLPCKVSYQAHIKSSLAHPGGIVEIKQSYPELARDENGYIKRTKLLGEVVLDEGDIEYTAHQFEHILAFLEKQEDEINIVRSQALKDNGISGDIEQAQQRVWDEIEGIRETNELNEGVLASLNEMAKYRKQERSEDDVLTVPSPLQAVQTS